MIKVSITQDGEFLDEIEFDGSNLVARAGALAVIHRDVMDECADDSLWHRVAHAARIVAERGDLLDLLEAQHRRAATNADAALSATSPDTSPDPDDALGGEAPSRAMADNDLYHLERGTDETDEEYQSAAGCSVATRTATSDWRGERP